MSLYEFLEMLADAKIQLSLVNGSISVSAPKGAVTPAIMVLLKEHKSALTKHLQRFEKVKVQINRVDRNQIFPLSFAQQRLWLLDQIDGGSTHYNMPSALKLTGNLNHEALQQAFTTILQRHDSLRTCFAVDENGQPIQMFQAAVPFVVPVVDLSGLEEGARQLSLTQCVVDRANVVFDLSRDLMLRAQLIKVATDEHILLVTMHHIASDGWSTAILIKEFSALYSAYAQSQVNPLPPLAIQYADYAHWQRNWLQGDALDQQLSYWEKQLASLPVVHSLPLDHPRPAIQSFAGATYRSQIDATTNKNLNTFCKSQGATLFMALHAAFSVLLSRYSNETDIVMGSPIANREQAEVAGLIGFFVNTLVLRSNLSENPNFIDLLSQSKNMLLDAYAHQQVPFEQIVERLQPERSLSHGALFQVMLVLQNNKQGVLELPGLTLSPIEQEGTLAKYDLTLNVVENEQGIRLRWEYNTDLFKPQTIERMANHFELLLDSLLKAPNENVFSADMISNHERQQLLVDWNNTHVDYPKDKCIHELFETQVDNNPDAIAAVFENQTLSYRQLNEKANQLAHYLITQKQVTPDTLVGICVERSLDMVIGILAILKAGGAYVPLDPEYPEARLKYMLDDANLTTVLTQRHLCEKTPVTIEQAVCQDSDEFIQQLHTYPVTNIKINTLHSNHLAYVIYTSGSTGNPKGVMVEHSALVNRIVWMDREYGSSPSDRILQKTPFSFDVSVWEFVWPLSVGAGIVLAKPEGHKDPVYLSALIRDQHITKLHFVPSMLGSMLALGDLSQCTSLRQVFCSGEALALHHVDTFQAMYPWAELHNLYGPTEAAIDVSYWDCAQRDANLGSVPIGRPIGNIQLHVLNTQLLPVPQHVAGELHIGGVGLARGYLNRAELTAEKFVPNPFYDKNNPSSSKCLYKTGDLVRWLPDSNLEYLGRIDHQVKIRGFRIELGEIENTISTHTTVKDAVVLAKESAAGDKRLVAYVVTEQENNSELIESLRHHLRQTLPDHMVPSAFVLLENLPLTPNGKVDRKALPEPDISAQQHTYIAPTTETEKILCEIWQEVLDVERIGITDNFFQLGGHSLLATRLIAQINKTFNVTLPFKSLFDSQTLEKLAQAVMLLDTNLAQPVWTRVSRDEVMLASYAQQRLWLIDQIEGGSAHYNMPIALRLNGTLDVAAMNQAFTSILERHESLRTCYAVNEDGQPIQMIQAVAPFVIPVVDLSGLEHGERQSQLAERSTVEASQVFDLRQDIMLRAQLIKLAVNEHIILVTMHHIASDGWSIAILINELSALYRAYTQGVDNPLPPLAIQYADYAHWQRNWLQREVLDQQLGYWERQLASLPVVHSLPMDHPRPAIQTFAGATYRSQVDAITIKALSSLCQAQGATLFMGLHAAFSVLLSRYSNETDIVIGSLIANREQVEIAGLIGFFVNTLVLRSDLSESPSFTALLGQSKGMLLDAYAHQQVPFEQIVERLQPERSLSHSALFQVMLVLQNNEQGVLELPGLTINPIKQTEAIAKYELTLTAIETLQGLQLEWGYNTDLFEPNTIKRMANHFGTLLNELLAKPNENVFKTEMLDVKEFQQILTELNNTQADYPKEKCIHELFEAQVEIYPDSIAVIFEDKQLTYAELNHKSNQLAHYLISEKQIKPDTLVGICVERSLEMVVGILAILKAGGAYVPLDPEYPEARLKYMLDDAKLSTVLTQSHLLETTPVSDEQAVCLDDEKFQHQLQTYPTSTVKVNALTSNHLAYVIYTSGSTGNPKGVLIEHHALVCSTLARISFYEKKLRSFLLLSSIGFDSSVAGLFWSLVAGASVVIIDNKIITNVSELALTIARHKVNYLLCVPSFYREIVQSSAYVQHSFSLDGVILAGESLPLSLVADHYSATNSVLLFNEYGPTEATVWSSCFNVPVHFNNSSVPIGKSPNLGHLLILNKENTLTPEGIAGELHIGGVGLSRGYLNRPDLTAEKFIPNPFYDKNNPASSERLYKTGDLVRWLPEGNLEYLGRIDHQVKIRGFRIELGEIENALGSHVHVKDAVVLAKESAMTGDKHLVAYVVTEHEHHPEFIEGLRQHVTQSLPAYMMPSAFVLLESLPLTPNGKVDRKALPEPDMSAQQNIYVAPRSETEKILCEIWQDVLGIERVGITDNFFHLGGHSLLATRLTSRINQTFNVTLPLKTLFNAQTPGGLAQAVLLLDTNLSRPPLTRVLSDGVFLTSYAQQRLWLLDQIDGGSAHYNMPSALRLAGNLNHEALQQAFTTILERHDSLRTRFAVDENGQSIQIIQTAIPFAIPIKDLSTTNASERELQLTKIISEEANKVFNLSCDLMLRAQLINVAIDEHILLVTMHHIASDGWSMSILINEFSALYGAYVQGQSNPLTPLAIQYVDYAHWQRNWLQGEVLSQQLSYWEKQLASLPVVHSLPLDYPRPAIQSFAGATYRSTINATTREALNSVCQSQGATLFMGLHAAFSVLLSRYSNETDIVVGSPIANREQAEVANLIGFFVNTLVLRSDLSENPSFTELLSQSKTMLLDAYAHQQVPFEQIVERLQPERSLRHSALFQVMLVLQNNEQGVLELPGLTLSPIEQGRTLAKYDLTLNVIENEQGLLLAWEYNTNLFNHQTIERMANHFELLLDSLLKAPNKNVFSVDMLSAQERQQLLIDWNNTQVHYPNDKCIHELFEQQVEKNPDAIALMFEDKQLTYKQLNEKANQLAYYLIQKKHVKPDSLVGICVERSLDMIVGILAILKAGGAYVPLDPEYPEARLKYMLDDAMLTTVLTQLHLRETTPVNDEQAVCLDDEKFQQQLQTYPTTTVKVNALTSNHLAYVIYTSGSTGNPKGVVQTHKTISNLIQGLDLVNNINRCLMTLQFASSSFDVSIQEIATTWHTGSTLLLISDDVKRNLIELPHVLREHSVERIFLPPAVLYWLADTINESGNLPNLKEIFAAGEALILTEQLEQFLQSHPECKLWNHYGPTETHVATCHLVSPQNKDVPIGKVISGLQVMILNNSMQMTPVNVAGELYIGGSGLARGYLNLPELTAEKFISNPLHNKNNSANNERLYRTGDLVRWLPNGNLEFLGRIDHQVKIRGFRIELGEIEHALISHADVKEAVVLARQFTSSRDKRLVAYIGTDVVAVQDNNGISKHQLFIENLRHHLNQVLPDYMMPSTFVLLDQLPLTPNGKVDRKSLPEPDVSAQQNTYVAPRTSTEKILCDILQEMLDVERVGINDNFFRIGGDSLSAVKFKSIANKRGINFTLRDVIHVQSMRKLAEISNVGYRDEEALNSHGRDEIPLLPEQKWFFSENFTNPELWNIKSIFSLDFELDSQIAYKAISHLASIHDALLCKFAMRDGGMVAVLNENISPDVLLCFDHSALDEDAQNLAIQRICREQENKLNYFDGPLFSVVYFYLGKRRKPLLFSIFHHLIFDAASVDIFFDDFKRIYFSLLNNIDSLPLKRMYSLSSIVNAVNDIIEEAGSAHRIEYWMSQPFSEYRNYKTDFLCEKENNLSSSVKSCIGSLSKLETEMLQEIAVKRLGLALIDVIYYALSRALILVNDGDYIPIWHIASGRSFVELNSDVEMDRAIAWLSMPSPRFIKIDNDKNIIENLQDMVNGFKKIPDSGCSYLPLFYSNDKRTEKIAFFGDENKVILNHLGVITRDVTLKEVPFIEVSSNKINYRACLFNCVTKIENNELNIIWGYSDNQYKLETIDTLVEHFLAELRKIAMLGSTNPEQVNECLLW